MGIFILIEIIQSLNIQGEEMIKIEHLNKTYKSNKVKALDDINIEIKKGDIYGIVGLSGAGKSSLVRCINRLEEADSGKIIINNVDILSLSKKELIEQRKKIGMIFQSFNLFSLIFLFSLILFTIFHKNIFVKVNTFLFFYSFQLLYDYFLILLIINIMPKIVSSQMRNTTDRDRKSVV